MRARDTLGTWSDQKQLIMNGISDNGAFGRSTASTDFNGDGFTDMVVGAPIADIDSLLDTGSVTVFFGGNDMDSVADITMSGTADMKLGISIQ